MQDDILLCKNQGIYTGIEPIRRVRLSYYVLKRVSSKNDSGASCAKTSKLKMVTGRPTIGGKRVGPNEKSSW